MEPLSDFDFSMLPEGDFPEDIETLLPALTGPEDTGFTDDGYPSRGVPIQRSTSGPGPMALEDTSEANTSAVPTSSALSLQSMFPDGGSRISPLTQYRMLDSRQSRKSSIHGGAGSQFKIPPGMPAGPHEGWPAGLAPPNRDPGAGAILPYDDTQQGNFAKPSRIKREPGLATDLNELPAIEFSSWDAAERDRVKRSPPSTIEGISDLELAYIELKDLNRLMEKAGYTEEMKKATKVRRRKVKNRNSAKGSATKKRSQFHSITATNKQLLDVVSELQNRNDALTSANTELQQQTEHAKQVAEQALREKEAFQREIARLTEALGKLESSPHN